MEEALNFVIAESTKTECDAGEEEEVIAETCNQLPATFHEAGTYTVTEEVIYMHFHSCRKEKKKSLTQRKQNKTNFEHDQKQTHKIIK